MQTYSEACASAARCSMDGSSVHVNAIVRKAYNEAEPKVIGYQVSNFSCSDCTVHTYTDGRIRD